RFLLDLLLLLLELRGLGGPRLLRLLLDLLERVARLLEVLDGAVLVPSGQVQRVLLELLPRRVLRVARLHERLQHRLARLLRERILVEEVVAERPGPVVQVLLLLLELLGGLLGRRLGLAGILGRPLLVLDRLV